MTSRRTFLALLMGFAAASFVGLSGCSSHNDPWEGKGGPPRVVVSIPPLYSFVKAVGGDKVAVICICTTTGPHEYAYNHSDALAARKADVLLGIGLKLDDKFMDKLRSSSGKPDLKFVQLGDGLKDKKLIKTLEGEDDPHVWLGVETAKELVQEIAKQLKAVDRTNADTYQKNADAYCEKLTALQKEFRTEMKAKEPEKIMPTHDSLQYFADSFGLTITEPLEKTPGENPSPEWTKQLLKICTDEEEKDPKKRKPVRLIATEPQYEKKYADTLKAELKKKGIDAVLFEIDPLETADAKELDADWYLKKMRANLDNILKNLKDKE
jgi:zinc transport system substrate-binding protein